MADWRNRLPECKPDHYFFPRAEGNTPPDQTRHAQGWRTAWRTVTRAVECPNCGCLQSPGDCCWNPECKAVTHDLNSPLDGLRFHYLRHTAITKLAESQASDQTIMANAGHGSRQMSEHYSHIRMAAKRAALEAISTPLPDEPSPGKANGLRGDVHQNGNQMKKARNEWLAKLLN